MLLPLPSLANFTVSETQLCGSVQSGEVTVLQMYHLPLPHSKQPSSNATPSLNLWPCYRKCLFPEAVGLGYHTPPLLLSPGLKLCKTRKGGKKKKRGKWSQDHPESQ